MILTLGNHAQKVRGSHSKPSLLWKGLMAVKWLVVSTCFSIPGKYLRYSGSLPHAHGEFKTIPARDPKQCTVRILKGKMERTQHHQWLQAGRTRATLVAKRRDTKYDSASPLCEDLCARSSARSPWQVLCISCCARSLCKRTQKRWSCVTRPILGKIYRENAGR